MKKIVIRMKDKTLLRYQQAEKNIKH